MVCIIPEAPDFSAGTVPAANVTAVTYHTGTGKCSITHVNSRGMSTVTDYYGKAGVDLYNALVVLHGVTPSSTT